MGFDGKLFGLSVNGYLLLPPWISSGLVLRLSILHIRFGLEVMGTGQLFNKDLWISDVRCNATNLTTIFPMRRKHLRI